MRIGLICAFEEEGKKILQQMQITERITKLKNFFYKGWFHDLEIVFAISGMGKVSAALCTQILIDHFSVDLVIFSGIAGGVNPALKIGDTVIGTEVFYHDVDLAGENITTGTIDSIFRNRFKTDSGLIKILARELKPEKYPLLSELNRIEDSQEAKIIFGRVVTGDKVITSRTKVLELYNNFAADCVEMEGAAVAHTCVLNDKPFLIIRTISDLANEDALKTIKRTLDVVLQINYFVLSVILNILRDNLNHVKKTSIGLYTN